MKKGDIVIITSKRAENGSVLAADAEGKSVGYVGIIVYKKNNNEIGVNYGHFAVVMLKFKTRNPLDMKIEYFLGLGITHDFFDKTEMIKYDEKIHNVN